MRYRKCGLSGLARNDRADRGRGRNVCDARLAFETAPKLRPRYAEVSTKYVAKEKSIGDPTQLILVDEADRLKMASLEQMRAVFDAGGIGMVPIGMPGLEKRLARYQFYSRIGFVQEFRPLNATEMRRLLAKRWSPPGVTFPEMDSEAVASVIRIT
jgi:type II secretory pathway predicted ATPase ExeA